MISRECAHCGYLITTGGSDSRCPECGGAAPTALERLNQLRVARIAACVLIVALPAWVLAFEFEGQVDVIPTPRTQGLIFAAIAVACALATRAVGYVRFSAFIGGVFLAGGLLPILLISARNFNIENHATIVRTDLVWHALVWSFRIAFSLTIAFGLIVFSMISRATDFRSRWLASNTAAGWVAGLLLFSTLAGPWAHDALWQASQGMWQSNPANSSSSPPVPNLIGLRSVLEGVRLFALVGSLFWLWVLALLGLAATSSAIDRIRISGTQ